MDKELIVLVTCLHYITSLLEKEGCVKNNKITGKLNEKTEDIKFAYYLGRDVSNILKNVKFKYQERAIKQANKIFATIEKKQAFNYLTFVMVLLLQFKEHFKSKKYNINVTYKELTDMYDKYLEICFEDKLQMRTLKYSRKFAEEFFDKLINYDNKGGKE